MAMLPLAIAVFGMFMALSTVAIAEGSLPDGWREIAPGGNTICARGEPFSFFVKDGPSEKVVIDFIGGGACWDSVSCSVGSATFTDKVDGLRDSISEGLGGVYSNNPENPYRDYTHVLIPYCTGDLHWGNATRTYTKNGQSFNIHHKGAVNAAAVLAWVRNRKQAPERIHVTGCSAGSYGSIYWTPYIQEQYRNAIVTQFGDAGAGIIAPGSRNDGIGQWNVAPAAPRWVPGLDPADIDYSLLPLDEFYNRVARHYPYTRFAQYNTSFDFIQTLFFVRMGGRQNDWNGLMRQSIDRIEQASPNFRSYIAPGSSHCSTTDDDFYMIETDGTRLGDWLTNYVELAPVRNVQCGSNCE